MRNLNPFYFYITLFFLSVSCVGAIAQNGDSRETTSRYSKKNKVLFFDDFNRESSLPDTTIWKPCKPGNSAWNRFFKGVKGYENIRVEKGHLVLIALKHNGIYKTGGVFSTVSFPCNTRLEVKAKLNRKVRGGFPAIWQMPVEGHPWPKGGEIDLMEWISETPNQVYQTVHSYYTCGEKGGAGVTNPRPDKNFDVTAEHIYAVERTPDELRFYIDGKETWRYKNQYLAPKLLQYPFCDAQFDIILNYSLGGMLNGKLSWAGKIVDADLPGEMWVDWVRVTTID